MHAFRQQSLPIIKALCERHVQTGIEYEIVATRFPRDPANFSQQLGAYARALQTGSHDEVIDIDKPAIDQVFHEPISCQADRCLTIASRQKPITLRKLPLDLSGESIGGAQVRTQFLHHAEGRCQFGRAFEVLKHSGLVHEIPSRRGTYDSLPSGTQIEPKTREKTGT